MSSDSLLDPLFGGASMQALFSARGRLQGMLDFEAALARAEAGAGVIRNEAVAAIEAQCRAELFDADALARETASAGNPAIPLVRALTALVARADEQAAHYVHWGATSQDAMDTGLMLQLRAAFDLFDADLARLADALAQLARRHRDTLLPGRTWLQHAVPVTFGLKAAGWMSAIDRHRTRLREARPRVLALQFGGAAGTLASLGERGLQVAAALADDLRLGLPDLPWHSVRDRVGEAATVLGLIVGTLGKMARDLSLMMQTEVGEAFEPSAPGRGGSSAMPHKRNPVGCAVALSAALRVPALVSVMLGAAVQEHERGLGDWHAEWETLPEICNLAFGALAQMADIVEGLEVDAERMQRNLDLTLGLLFAESAAMALAEPLGRSRAHHVVEEASRRAIVQKRHLREVLAEDGEASRHLSPQALERIFDARRAAGLAGELVDRALAARKEP